MKDLNRRDLMVDGAMMAATAAAASAMPLGAVAQAAGQVPARARPLGSDIAATAFFDGVSRAGDPATAAAAPSGNGFY